MSCQQEIIKKFCSSHLDHQVHIPKIRSTLYVKSLKTFQELHEKPSVDTLYDYAKKYSNVLKDQIQSVEKYYGTEATKERHMYQQLERIWDLCQILYFPEPAQVDTETLLMDWYNNAYKPYLFEFDRQSIFFCKSTFDHPDFWPYAIRLILFGRLEQLSILFSHVLKDTEFQLHWDLLEFMQCLKELTCHGIQHLKSQHTELQQLLSRLCHIQNSSHAENLKDVKHGNGDASIRLFLEGRIYEATEACAEYDWWLIAHLVDLLNMKDMMNRSLYYTLEDGATLTMGAREYFILTYASNLNNQFGLWEESFTYLMTCGEIGKAAVIEHLRNMDFQNDDKKLNDVVNFCIEYSMKNDGLVLFEEKASRCLESKQYKQALEYYSQAGKYQYLDHVFNSVLEDFIHTGQLYDIRDIWHINALFSLEKYQEAADTFKALLSYDCIPRLMMPVIFAEGWKIIDRRVHFNLNDLLIMKTMCQDLWKLYKPEDFGWYHYYKCNGYNIDGNDGDITNDVLTQDMSEFFDTASIIITRAIDVFEKS
ncbi:Nup85 nucleoporin-domain-containing protein [Mucor mucedo]|uniref:Nup85 nucleoporin-domain-containing protein n=1 Tax=Mucor mucedo TaxID=29922 RepID=UPI00221F3B74|nr:Nup85 nucleoporin-domain-containing protein [Mucor mucedo]KAI7892343.1 Nup85 nucleoporin-domain-containing protein [Mucor mucedo]